MLRQQKLKKKKTEEKKECSCVGAKSLTWEIALHIDCLIRATVFLGFSPVCLPVAMSDDLQMATDFRGLAHQETKSYGQLR